MRGFEIANLADHHDVRILAQNRAQAARERHLDFRVHLRLADPVDVVLDRILDGHDVARVVVDALERGVERRRLTRAGRTGDEQNAVRLVDELVHERLRARIHAERVELQAAGLLVEQTQYEALAIACRNRRDANVDRTDRCGQRDESVLRQALLGDVELRHDLDARDDERGDGALRLQYLAKHAVNAKPDDETVFERLDMDIGRIVLYGLRQDGVDQLDDRRLIV